MLYSTEVTAGLFVHKKEDVLCQLLRVFPVEIVMNLANLSAQLAYNMLQPDPRVRRVHAMRGAGPADADNRKHGCPLWLARAETGAGRCTRLISKNSHSLSTSFLSFDLRIHRKDPFELGECLLDLLPGTHSGTAMSR